MPAPTTTTKRANMKRIATAALLTAITIGCSSCEAEKHETTTTEIHAGGDVIITDGEGNVIDQFASTNVTDAASAAK